MGVSKYMARGKVRWRVDTYVALPDGKGRRIRMKRIPTREQAEALEHKMLAEAFEGRFFDRVKEPTATVRELWSEYEPITKRDNDSWQSDVGRSAHLIRLLGDRRASRLTRGDVEEYRTKRQAETTRRGGTPAPGTLDREVELLKRVINYAVACGRLPTNSIAGVKLLRVPNVRRVVLDEEAFQRLLTKAEAWLRPILLVAFDTGMRKSEVLNLRWSQLDLKAGAVRLGAEDTKTDEPRVVYLTERVLRTLAEQPRLLHADYVFVNPATGRPYADIQGAVERAREASGLGGVWVHDLRRSFVTLARRSGLPESVVARFSGHRTPAVFKRYNIVEEQDLKAAVEVLNRSRASTGSARADGGTAAAPSHPGEANGRAGGSQKGLAAAAGRESDTVDER
jgi:integrase